jgi:hypothetical protein
MRLRPARRSTGPTGPARPARPAGRQRARTIRDGFSDWREGRCKASTAADTPAALLPRPRRVVSDGSSSFRGSPSRRTRPHRSTLTTSPWLCFRFRFDRGASRAADRGHGELEHKNNRRHYCNVHGAQPKRASPARNRRVSPGSATASSLAGPNDIPPAPPAPYGVSRDRKPAVAGHRCGCAEVVVDGR